MVWTVALRKKEIGLMIENLHPQYSFPSTVLKPIRAMVPQNIKGELGPDTFNLTLQEFCDGLDTEIDKVKINSKHITSLR